MMNIKTVLRGGSSPIIDATVYLDDNHAFRYTFSRVGYSELQLTEYTHLEKEGKQRKFRSTKVWDKYDRRNNKISFPPAPPKEICDAVLQCYVSILYVTWPTETAS